MPTVKQTDKGLQFANIDLSVPPQDVFVAHSVGVTAEGNDVTISFAQRGLGPTVKLMVSIDISRHRAAHMLYEANPGLLQETRELFPVLPPSLEVRRRSSVGMWTERATIMNVWRVDDDAELRFHWLSPGDAVTHLKTNARPPLVYPVLTVRCSGAVLAAALIGLDEALGEDQKAQR